MNESDNDVDMLSENDIQSDSDLKINESVYILENGLSSSSVLPIINEKISSKICVIFADITKLEVDVIVNAANVTLLGI
jgi:hypothetical protein